VTKRLKQRPQSFHWSVAKRFSVCAWSFTTTFEGIRRTYLGLIWVQILIDLWTLNVYFAIMVGRNSNDGSVYEKAFLIWKPSHSNLSPLIKKSLNFIIKLNRKKLMLLFNENRIILASPLLSQYTVHSHHRQTNDRQHFTTIAKTQWLDRLVSDYVWWYFTANSMLPGAVLHGDWCLPAVQ